MNLPERFPPDDPREWMNRAGVSITKLAWHMDSVSRSFLPVEKMPCKMSISIHASTIILFGKRRRNCDGGLQRVYLPSLGMDRTRKIVGIDIGKRRLIVAEIITVAGAIAAYLARLIHEQ